MPSHHEAEPSGGDGPPDAPGAPTLVDRPVAVAGRPDAVSNSRLRDHWTIIVPSAANTSSADRSQTSRPPGLSIERPDPVCALHHRTNRRALTGLNRRRRRTGVPQPSQPAAELRQADHPHAATATATKRQHLFRQRACLMNRGDIPLAIGETSTGSQRKQYRVITDKQQHDIDDAGVRHGGSLSVTVRRRGQRVVGSRPRSVSCSAIQVTRWPVDMFGGMSITRCPAPAQVLRTTRSAAGWMSSTFDRYGSPTCS